MLLLACCQDAEPLVSQVKIWDQDFHVIQTIDDPATLGEFTKMWNARTEVSPSERPTYSHKVDIMTDKGSTRWLYDPRGYATVLSKTMTPVYCFRNPEALNSILIPQQGAEVDAKNPAP